MIASRYAKLLKEIEQSGKSPRIVAVTKNATLSQMKEAYSLGIRDFAESRLQDALEKIPHFSSDVYWHFIGRIQSNKAAKIAQTFEFIHSVSSEKTLKIIGERPRLFLQVNISKETAKSGFAEQELFSLDLSSYPQVIGLMTIAPLSEDSEEIQACFHKLAQLKKTLKLPHLSMGMSQDFQLALAEGATFLRIGSYLFS